MQSHGQPDPPVQFQPDDSCLHCRRPLPKPHRRSRRFCSASCRTMAYEVRAAQGPAPQRGEANPGLPVWMEGLASQLSLLSSARGTLEAVSGALAGLARSFEAEEMTLRRALDVARAQHSQTEALQRDLMETRQRLSEREAELNRLHQALRERDVLAKERQPAQQALVERDAALPSLDEHATGQKQATERQAGDQCHRAEQFAEAPWAAATAPIAAAPELPFDDSQQVLGGSPSDETDISAPAPLTTIQRVELDAAKTTSAAVSPGDTPLPRPSAAAPPLSAELPPPQPAPAASPPRPQEGDSRSATGSPLSRPQPAPPAATVAPEQERRRRAKYDLLGPKR